MKWKSINSLDELESLLNKSEGPQIFFKHSNRCHISAMVKSRFESKFDQTDLEVFLVPVIESRPLSNSLAELSGVRHESPQLLINNNKSWVLDASHHQILDVDLNNLELA